MLVTVDGIVIGRRDVGENNNYLDFLTEEYGVIEVLVHGGKKFAGKNTATTQLFSYATFCMNKVDFKYTINSTSPIYYFYKLSNSIDAFALAVYFADLIKFCSASEQRDVNLLRLFAITLYELEQVKVSFKEIKAIFEFKLAAMIGFMPDLTACHRCLRYEIPTAYFSFDNCNITCDDCYTGESNVFALSDTLLYVLRYVIFTDISHIYNFTLTGQTLLDFSGLAERYILEQLGRNFSSLDYYKNI